MTRDLLECMLEDMRRGQRKAGGLTWFERMSGVHIIHTKVRNVKEDQKVAPGHVSKGTVNGNAFLTETDIIDIRTLFAFGARAVILAAAFVVSVEQIRRIVRRATWKHVP